MSGSQPVALAASFLAAVAAGTLLVFSDFVGRALASSPDEQAVQVMQRINAQAPRSPLFVAVLFLPALLAVVAGVLAAHGGSSRATVVLVAAAAIVYAVGVVGMTVAFQVPRNDALALRDVAQGWAGWQDWWRAWRVGNVVRVLSAAASSICLLVAASR